MNVFSLPTKTFSILNLIVFKVLWLILVIFQEALIVPAILIILGLLAIYPSKSDAVKYLLMIACPGILIDSLLILAGLFEFSSPVIPAWLILLWLSLALSLAYGFSFIAKLSIPLQALVGVVTSFSYLIGMNLGAVSYPQPLVLTQALLMIVWAVLIPVFYKLIALTKRVPSYESA